MKNKLWLFCRAAFLGVGAYLLIGEYYLVGAMLGLYASFDIQDIING